jgi:hypothetical protein
MDVLRFYISIAKQLADDADGAPCLSGIGAYRLDVEPAEVRRHLPHKLDLRASVLPGPGGITPKPGNDLLYDLLIRRAHGGAR